MAHSTADADIDQVIGSAIKAATGENKIGTFVERVSDFQSGHTTRISFACSPFIATLTTEATIAALAAVSS